MRAKRKIISQVFRNHYPTNFTRPLRGKLKKKEKDQFDLLHLPITTDIL